MIKNLKRIHRYIVTGFFSPKKVFHGDLVFRRAFVELGKMSSSITETGTYFGWTTEYLAKFFPTKKINTCEINKGYYLRAKSILRKHSNISMYNGSSPECLRKIFDENLLGKKPLFFLDAHWRNYWPIEDELKLISNELDSAIIFIDDFKIDDEKFAFDVWNGKECSLDLVKPNLNKKNKYNLIFPKYSDEEVHIEEVPHDHLVGYAILFQNSEKEFQEFLKNPQMKKFFQDKSNLLKK